MSSADSLKHVVILAGGKGTRLRPYTTTIPKPLVPVGERPILEIVLHQLRAAGVERVTLTVSHLADLLRAFFGRGEKVGLQIDYSTEDIPLGTIGPLTLLSDLPDDFLVMNGDILTDIDYQDLFRAHRRAGVELTVATYRRESVVDFGVVQVDAETRRISAFQEKPRPVFDVSMGVYAMSRAVLRRVPTGRPFGFDQLMLNLLQDGVPVQAYPFSGYWLDIGRPEDYDEANRQIDSLAFAKGP